MNLDFGPDSGKYFDDLTCQPLDPKLENSTVKHRESRGKFDEHNALFYVTSWTSISSAGKAPPEGSEMSKVRAIQFAIVPCKLEHFREPPRRGARGRKFVRCNSRLSRVN